MFFHHVCYLSCVISQINLIYTNILYWKCLLESSLVYGRCCKKLYMCGKLFLISGDKASISKIDVWSMEHRPNSVLFACENDVFETTHDSIHIQGAHIGFSPSSQLVIIAIYLLIMNQLFWRLTQCSLIKCCNLFTYGYIHIKQNFKHFLI